MKKAVFAALCAAACCAFAALKPGYRYHGDLKPSDQVPANYETVISNYLEQSGYAPTVTTNREYIVQSVTNNFYEVHSVTNRFYDEKWVTNSIVTNIYQVTHEDHYVTNTVQRNFVQNFEYWHTNNFYEVTNVTVYLTTETTNVIWNVTTNTVVEPHYVVSNFVDHTYHTNEYYTFETREVTNRITSVIETLYTNIVTREDHYIDRYYTTHKTNNYYFVTNLVTHEDHWVTNNFTWTTNIVTREDHWITNNVIDTHEDHWITNNIIYTHEDHYVTNNFYEVTNFVEHTYHTNNFYETVYQTTNVYHTVYETTNLYHNVYETNNLTTVSNIYHNTYTDHWHTNNLVEHTWHTNNLVVNTLSNVFVTVNVTNREDYYVYTTERVTNEVETVKYITDVYVTSNLTVVGTNHSHYSHWYTDRISATNGFSVCEIDALNRIYTQVDEQGFYGKKVKGSSLWNTFDANRYTRYVAFYDNPIWYPNPLDTTFPLDMLEGTDGNDGMVLYGKFMPVFEYMGESRQYSGFLVLGGWLSISGTTTNWVTSKTAPALNHVIRNYYSETTTYITWTNGTYLASANLPASFRTKAGTMWYNPKNGRIIYAYPYSGSQSYLGNYIYWQTSENTADKMITNRVYTVGQLATVDELADYSSAHTASEVVTNSTFVSMVTDAMYPYTLMSLTNAQNAAASAAAAAGSATTAKSYSDNMPAQVQSAVASATATARTAAQNATSAMANIQTLANTASTAASTSQSYANDAQRTYGLIQAFTNWFYNALVSGGCVTNVHIYTPDYVIDKTTYKIDLNALAVYAKGGLTLTMKTTASSQVTTGIAVREVGGGKNGWGVHYGSKGFVLKSGRGAYTDYADDFYWATDGYWYINVRSVKSDGTSKQCVCRAAGSPYLTSSLTLNRYSGDSSTSTFSLLTSVTIARYSGTSTSVDLIGTLASSDEIAKAIAKEVTDRNTAISTAISGEVTARNTAISTAVSGEVTARNTAIEAKVTSVMSDITSIISASSYDHICEYNVYFDTAGQIQGTFKLDTGRYTSSGSLRTYQIYDIAQTSYTSSTYGKLSAVQYTWNMSSGSLVVVLTGSKGPSRTYTATQSNPVANYYGAQWSLIKASDTTYPGSGVVIDTTGKTYLNPLVRLVQAAANTNTTYIIGN